MTTRQRVGGAVLAVIGAVGVTASAYLDWFGGRDATDIPLERLFQTDVTEQASSYWNSVALPLAVVTVLAVVGALLLSRFILAVAWLVGVAALVLWIVMQANDDTDPLQFGDLQVGVWVCAVGLVVMLLGIGSMRGPDTDRDVVQDDTPVAKSDADA